MIQEDLFMGMLLGHNLGDALGAPHEFTTNNQYTGQLIHEVNVRTRFQGTKTFPVGSVTDDTGMTFALLDSIIRNNLRYNVKDVCLSYMVWSNEWKLGQGKNTRALFCHPYKRDGLKNYLEAYNTIFTSVDLNSWTQSNGSLMRCCPLALFDQSSVLNWFQVDTRQSNPHPINQDCNIVYGAALWMAIRGISREQVWESIKTMPQTKELKEVIDIIIQDREYSIAGKGVKGHVLRAFWCSMLVFRRKPNREYMKYKEIVDILACIPNTDTDTNAAIAGALAGAFEGWDTMLKDDVTKSNMEIIQRVNGIDYQKYRNVLFVPN